MVAARGRKRTDDPTPNRARDIQRAFRARRAAHLESLEERIALLERENAHFRQLLGMLPAERPPLGKGPTGRGMAKSRSRTGLDAKLHSSNSPTPSSDTPTTPGTDPSELPALGMSTHAYDNGMPHLVKDEIGTNPSYTFPGEIPKYALNPLAQGDQYTPYANMVPDISNGLVTDFDPLSLQHGLNHESPPALAQLPFQTDLPWATNSLMCDDTDDTPVQGRGPFAYPHTMAPRSDASHFQHHLGHRRANTEPHAVGSTLQNYLSDPRTTLSDFGSNPSPSPPPLPIRTAFTLQPKPMMA